MGAQADVGEDDVGHWPMHFVRVEMAAQTAVIVFDAPAAGRPQHLEVGVA